MINPIRNDFIKLIFEFDIKLGVIRLSNSISFWLKPEAHLVTYRAGNRGSFKRGRGVNVATLAEVKNALTCLHVYLYNPMVKRSVAQAILHLTSSMNTKSYSDIMRNFTGTVMN